MGEILRMGPLSSELHISPEEFNILIAGLKQLPYIVSQPLIDRLRDHVRAQQVGDDNNAVER
jgi:hypothetical protein